MSLCHSVTDRALWHDAISHRLCYAMICYRVFDQSTGRLAADIPARQ